MTTTTETPRRGLMRPKDVAARLACDVADVHRLIARGDLAAVRIGNSRTMRVEPAEVDAYLLRCSEAMHSPPPAAVVHPDSRVYLVHMTSTDFYKVGTSMKPEVRVAALQTSSPVPLALVKVWAGGAVLERLFHDTLRDARVKGEWFRVVADDLARVIRQLDCACVASAIGEVWP